MTRAEWLKRMRAITEAIYDRVSPLFWLEYGVYDNETHLAFLRKFTSKVPAGRILSAACGAGRYDGFLLEAGHRLVGTDQSEGMLRQARERYPDVEYRKMGLQELDFEAEFDGATCIDALELVSPEDWQTILESFSRALKPEGWLYFTLEIPDPDEVGLAYTNAKAMDMPVFFGEVADRVEYTYELLMALEPGEDIGQLGKIHIYHFYPPLVKVRTWLAKAGFTIEEEGSGNRYFHFLVKKI